MPELTPRKIHRYGWRKDSLDARDQHLTFTDEQRATTFPAKGSLRPKMPAVVDQGQLGSCTGNAWAGAVEFQESVQGEGATAPSRLFIYYYERYLEGTTGYDAGAEIRDGAKVVATYGAPPETEWPYSDANPGPFTNQPSQQALTDAAKHRATRYYRVNQDIWDLKWCINNNYPVVFGFTVYDSFESGNWYTQSPFLMPVPASGESILGGHATVIVGYDDSLEAVEVRNSWGTGWGDGGYFFMPYKFISDANQASDFWTIRKES